MDKRRTITRSIVKNAKSAAPVRLKIGLKGDRRLTEKVILEVQAAARRVGLEVADIEVMRKPSSTRKARKPASGRKPRART